MFNSPSSTYLLDFEVVEIGPKLPSFTHRPSPYCSTIQMDHRKRNFEYSVAKGIAGPGISLTVSGDSGISNELPSFLEGDKVTGAVRISANNGEDIRAVHVSLKGRILTGRNSDAVCTFLDLRETLWTAESGDIEAHRDLTKNDGEKGQVFALPHTFSEPGVPARVHYELAVSLKQSRWKMNRRITTEIGCFQIKRTRPRSGYISAVTSFDAAADRLACWKALDFNFTGTVSQFQPRTVELLCTLSLKDSLCYTRGSSIPLLLKIRCQDKQALESVASPDAVVVQLNRRINYKDVQMCGGKSSRWSTVVESVGVATWMNHEEISSGPALSDYYHSTLIGKLELKSGLVPSAIIANLAIEYFLSVHPFSSPAFQPKDNKSALLLSQTIQITTDLSKSS
ncbi:MAG: hypothetical protein NXY57DRAFT_445450 [Lentinula lateritia]|nr:MAG: hypothetical protein NXY57DRAFT_445450 [Lentinula lateritia]